MAVDLLSSVWPEWQIEEKPLGIGSYGIVYKAVRRDHNVESYAAIKVITIPQNDSEVDNLRAEGLSIEDTRTYLEGIVNDFVSEIRLMESFKGVQNIVSVEDYKVVEKTDELGWDIFIRMELLTPFMKYSADRTLSEPEVIKLGIDICSALELCAKRSVIHRDIKPENIFINQFGDFKLGDFGIARQLEHVTSSMSRKGTYNYMAPEVERGANYDARVDIYSLGIVLYRLLNKNRLPFLDTEKQMLNPTEREAAVRRRLDGEALPPPCNASAAMRDIILCACAPDPEDRFHSAKAMKKALQSVLESRYRDELDKTVSVRRAEPNRDLDRTTSVRKAPQERGQEHRASSARVSQKKSGRKRDVGVFGQRKTVITLLILILALLDIVLLVFILPRITGHEHEWQPATCTEPETCSVCGKTRGDAAGHDWSVWQQELAPSCVAPGRLIRYCLTDPSHTETQEIPMVDHQYAEATYDAPRTCVFCGAQTGSSLPKLSSLTPSRQSPSGGLVTYTYNDKFSYDYNGVTTYRLRDNLGNEYDEVIAGAGGNQENWNEYHVAGQYKYISGVVFLNYRNRSNTAKNVRLTINCYDSSGALLFTGYDSGIVQKGVNPMPFTLDITGVEYIRVSIYGDEFLRLGKCCLCPISET